MEDKPVVHDLISKKTVSVTLPIITGIVLVLLGIATGFLLTRQKTNLSIVDNKNVVSEVGGEVEKGQVYGSSDEKAFRDQAEGKLEKGGVDGEGSHKLIRPGGEDQTAYLTSSTLNLDQFAGKKVKVWGETYKATKAGWFMDVGRLEVLE